MNSIHSSRILRILGGALLQCGAIFGLIYSLRSAVATQHAHAGSSTSLQRASELLPTNAAYLARLAEVDTDRSQHWLDRAIGVHPSAAALWMERAVQQEMAGDTDGAERSLLEATRLDRHYLPRWTLAAFYFRQRNTAKFRSAARSALEMAYNDPLPLFQMARALGISFDEIRQSMLPDRSLVYRGFIAECIRQKAYEPLAQAAEHLVRFGDAKEDRRHVLQAVDALHESGVITAREVWNSAVRAGWMPHAALGRSLTPNEEFRQEFLPGGFDWRVPNTDGVSAWRRNTGGLHVEFSGRQPQRCTLLTLPLVGTPGVTYQLVVTAQASAIGPGKGLRWRVGDVEWDAAADFLEQRFIFPATPPGGRPPALTLVYERAKGTQRVTGAFEIKRVSLFQVDSKAAQ